MGIVCSLYSGFSCEWFAWTPLPEEWVRGIFQSDPRTNYATSTGLFRFSLPASSDKVIHNNNMTEQDEESVDETEMDLPTTGIPVHSHPTDINIVGITTTDGHQCHRYWESGRTYSLLIHRDTDPWMFTAQLCFLLGISIALTSLLDTMIFLLGPFSPSPLSSSPWTDHHHDIPRYRCRRKRSTAGWLLASGFQASSCIAATPLCGGGLGGTEGGGEGGGWYYDMWSCPWLRGAYASGGAAWLYLLCWFLSLCGHRLIDYIYPEDGRTTVNHHHHHHYFHHHYYHGPHSSHHGMPSDDAMQYAMEQEAIMTVQKKKRRMRQHRRVQDESLGTVDGRDDDDDDDILLRPMRQEERLEAHKNREFTVVQSELDDPFFFSYGGVGLGACLEEEEEEEKDDDDYLNNDHENLRFYMG